MEVAAAASLKDLPTMSTALYYFCLGLCHLYFQACIAATRTPHLEALVTVGLALLLLLLLLLVMLL